MTITRQIIKEQTDETLLAMWGEILHWEQAGSIGPSNLRTVTAEVLSAIDAIGTEPSAMWLDFVAREVWRECAVRKLDVS